MWVVSFGRWSGEQDALLSPWFGGEAQKLVSHADVEAKK